MRTCCGLCTVAYPQFGEDGLHVSPDGVWRDHQSLRDLLIGGSLCQQFQNLLLARAERINEGLILSGRGRTALLFLQKRCKQVIDIRPWMMLLAAFQKRHEAGTFIEKVTQ